MRRPLPLAVSAVGSMLESYTAQQPCIGCQRPSPAQPCRSCEIECRATLARRWHVSHSPALFPVDTLYYFGLYSGSANHFIASIAPIAPITGVAMALRRFKYAGDRRAGHVLRRLLERNARTLTQPFDAIVPVPLHRSRMATRGLNQSAWLARGVAKALGLPLMAEALLRHHDGPAQASLGGRERRLQAREMFRLGTAGVADKRVLLVDDVFTTGTTVRAAAARLCSGGHALSVSALVLLVADPKLNAAATKRSNEPRRPTPLGR